MHLKYRVCVPPYVLVSVLPEPWADRGVGDCMAPQLAGIPIRITNLVIFLPIVQHRCYGKRS